MEWLNGCEDSELHDGMVKIPDDSLMYNLHLKAKPSFGAVMSEDVLAKS